MKKFLISTLLIISFCNILYAKFDFVDELRSKVASSSLVKNPIQVLGGVALGGLTLYGAHQAGVEHLLAKLGKGILNHKDQYPKVLYSMTAAWWGNFGYHYKKLDNIDKEVSNLILENNNWTAWQISQWDTAQKLNANQGSVKDELKNKLKDKKNKTIAINEIGNEKKQLEDWIRYVGSFSNFPEQFVKKVEETNRVEYASSILDPANAAKKALCAAQHLGKIDIKLDEDTNSDLVKQKNSNYLFYAKHWYHPLTWTLAPWSGKARILCAKLIRYYGRLCALENIVRNFKVQLSVVDQVKELSDQPRVKFFGHLNNFDNNNNSHNNNNSN